MSKEPDIRLRALEMRVRGSSVADIAQALDVPPSTVGDWMRAIVEERKAAGAYSVDGVRIVEDERLELLFRALLPKAEDGDASAVSTLVRVHAARAALWRNHADAPPELEHRSRLLELLQKKDAAES